MRSLPLVLLLILVQGTAMAQSGSMSERGKSSRAAPKQAPAAGQSEPGDPKSRGQARDHGAKHLAYCMRDWDAATHMTKEEWARTCRRVVKDRFQFRLDDASK